MTASGGLEEFQDGGLEGKRIKNHSFNDLSPGNSVLLCVYLLFYFVIIFFTLLEQRVNY